MSRWSADAAASLRICPVCSSEAVMASRIEDAGPAGLRCVVRCGGCETWRGATLPAPQGFALEYRLGRRQRRHRRRLARELRRLERGGARGGTGLIGGPLDQTANALPVSLPRALYRD
jgi:hypothetical protein